MLEFTLPPLKKRELSIAESSLSNTLTESDKKSVEQVASHSEVQIKDYTYLILLINAYFNIHILVRWNIV